MKFNQPPSGGFFMGNPMAEPVASTVGIAIAAGTITLSGSILGLHYG
jgi:hypothetical protein